MMPPKTGMPRHLLCFLTAVTVTIVIITSRHAEAQQQNQFLMDPAIAASLLINPMSSPELRALAARRLFPELRCPPLSDANTSPPADANLPPEMLGVILSSRSQCR